MVTRLALAAFGVSAVLTVGWLLFFHHAAPAKKGDWSHASKPSSGYLFCKECGFEITCAPGRENTVVPCPRCGTKKGTTLDFFPYSHNTSGWQGPPPSPLVPVLVIGSTVLMSVILLCLAWLGRRRHHPADVKVLHYRCQICGRRLRYSALQAGHKGVCPQCKKVFVFPVV
jgi:uncharacterized protein (TIGR03382 family)